uniref:Uncharacterized protein n=1 Tax=Coccolithus braarudii TaxID=221442 RepID=A0A6T7G5H7_9EUKA
MKSLRTWMLQKRAKSAMACRTGGLSERGSSHDERLPVGFQIQAHFASSMLMSAEALEGESTWSTAHTALPSREVRAPMERFATAESRVSSSCLGSTSTDSESCRCKPCFQIAV